jgi:tRNA(adenine34) deaminase
VDHERYMRRAIEVARGNPEAPFGAVIVDRETGEVFAEDLNRAGTNPVWHAEIGAIVNCAEAHPGVDWTRLALYTTAEPCPMCATAVLLSGIPHLVYGTSIQTLNGMGFPPLDISS